MLTHIKITSAKPSEKLYKLHDTLGLYLAVKPNGSKLWRMNYRFLGKQKTLHLGKWPAVGLAAARAKRDEARGGGARLEHRGRIEFSCPSGQLRAASKSRRLAGGASRASKSFPKDSARTGKQVDGAQSRCKAGG